MKLYYFNGKGRAEASRLVMNHGGKEFEDVRFSMEEWGAKYKAMSPSGQAPWIELDDGSKLTQSSAIQYYCAEKAGMLPSDPWQLARTHELISVLEEVGQPMQSTFAMATVEEKIAAREKLIAPDGAMTKKMKILETLVAGCSTPFYCGDTVTLADCVLFVFIGMLRSGFLDGITAQYADNFEAVLALRRQVAVEPRIKEMYAGDTGYEP